MVEARVLGRCFNRLMFHFWVSSVVGLFLLPFLGTTTVPVVYGGAFISFLFYTYYREVYLTGRTKVVDPHVLEYRGDDPPYFTKGYLGVGDNGEQFAWVCRYCGEYAIDGETDELKEVDCSELEAFEQLELETEENGNV